MNSELPIGFRFDPTDEELLRGFLFPRVIGDQLPWNGIVHKALYGSTAAPWQVFGDCMEGYWETKKEGGATKSTTYVFTDLVRVHNSKRISRTAGGGTWGGQTGPKKILHSDTGDTIGHMRMLSFEHPDYGGASSEYGHWIMHEYVLSDKVLKEIAKPGAGDMVVCKITRCVKNSGANRRQTPPQPQFFPPAVVDVQENGCMRAAEESGVQEVQETARCIENSGGDHQQPPQPQFFPPTAVAKVQETGRKRAAEESRFQEVQETVYMKQKSCGGGFTEATAVPEAEEVVDDSWLVSWLVSALEQDDNVEISSGGDNGSGLTEAAEESRVQEVQETARCIENYGGDHQQPPQPQFFPPAAVVDVQETGRKRAAEESLVQEVHETVCKKQKSCGGGFTEVEVIDLEADENIEISSGGNDGNGLTEAAEKEPDSWLVSDLEKEAANVELPYGGFSDMAAFAEAVAQSDLWEATATATATPLGFDDLDDNFDVGLLW